MELMLFFSKSDIDFRFVSNMGIEPITLYFKIYALPNELITFDIDELCLGVP